MKISQIHWAALPTLGGVETHLEALVAGLRAAGDEVFFAAGTPRARSAAYHPALRPGGGADGGATVGAESAGSLADLVTGGDVLHIHNPQWHRPETVDGLLSILDGRGWTGRCVFSVHNLADDESHVAWLRKWMVQHQPLLVTHSRFVATELAACLPDAAPLVLPLALPSDAPLADANDRHRPVPVVLQPTRLSTWKGSHLSLAAAVELLDAGRPLKFVHAGSGHLLWDHGLDRALLDRVQPWVERGRIRFADYPPELSWAAIRAADLVVHPTAGVGIRGEPYSMSVAQALLCVRPVVVSRSGNLPELVGAYPAASVVEPGDGTALRDAIAGFLDGEWPVVPPRPSDVDRLRAWHADAVPSHRALYHGQLA